MSSAGMSYEELQTRKKLLLEELAGTQNAMNKTNNLEGSIDIHHPERSPGWPIYRHQDYPRMMYHPIQLDPQVEAARLGVRRRNDANPNLAPLDLPAPKPLTRKVMNAKEQEEAEEQGFVRKPPVMKMDEAPDVFDPLANPELINERKRKRA